MFTSNFRAASSRQPSPIAIAVGVIGFLVVASFMAALSAALFLVVAPVLVGLAFYARWRLRRFLRGMSAQQSSFRDQDRGPNLRGQGQKNAPVIDAEYTVVRED